MMSRAKTVRMPLYDGSLSGMTNLSNSAWERGKMYTASRESINKLISCTDCKKYGVYLLLSSNRFAMGRPSIWHAASDGIWPTRWGGRSPSL